MTFYNGEYAPTVFISSNEDLKKQLSADDIGKEFIFLKKAVHCPQCKTNLKKSFMSQQKAEDYADKHTSYKKYSDHTPQVQQIKYDYKFTISDIAGTQANRTKLSQLKKNATSRLLEKAGDILITYEKTISELATIFGLTYKGNNIDDLADSGSSNIQSVKLNFSSANFSARLGLDDLIRAKDLIEDNRIIYSSPKETDRDDFSEVVIEGFSFQGRVIDEIWERATHLHHLMNMSGLYSSDHCYAWEYPYNFAVMKGADVLPEEPCAFCDKSINDWNDVMQDIHGDTNTYGESKTMNKFIHIDCAKHVAESRKLYSYAEKLQKEVIA